MNIGEMLKQIDCIFTLQNIPKILQIHSNAINLSFLIVKKKELILNFYFIIRINIR